MKDKLLLSTPVSSFVCKGWYRYWFYVKSPANKMRLSILKNRLAKTSCPSVTRVSPTLVRTKASASLYPKDSTSADATPDITVNIAKT